MSYVLTPIPGYEDYYAATPCGRIWTVRRRKFMSPSYSWDGYQRVIFRVNKVESAFTVHQLVLLTFVGPRPVGMVINHKNFIRDDNRVENLEYVTAVENNNYSTFHGRRKKTKNYSDDRLRPMDVKFIRSTRLSDRELSVLFCMRRNFINKIRNSKNYTWVS